jgi:hypothetical protein
MKFTLKKKLAAAGLVTAVALGAGVAAVAFWSTDSTGSGLATTGSQSGNQVTGSNAAGTLSPSSSPQALTASVTNHSVDEAVPTVTVTFTVTKAADVSGTCDNSNYVLSPANGVMTPADNSTLLSGGTRTYSGVSINYVDSATVNQDACQGATVHLTYTAS